MKKLLHKLLFILISVFFIVFYDELPLVILGTGESNPIAELLFFFGIPILLLIWLIKLSVSAKH